MWEMYGNPRETRLGPRRHEEYKQVCNICGPRSCLYIIPHINMHEDLFGKYQRTSDEK